MTAEFTPEQIKEGFKKLREPFPEHQIGHRPQPTIQKEAYDKLPKSTCSICGGYHPKEKTIHLAYVGHAALTDRLLDVDPTWTWRPMAFDEAGLPRFDNSGGLWAWVTILGITKPAYGHAIAEKQNSRPGDRTKELIGDLARNGFMRYGCALEYWHKGDLHLPGEPEEEEVELVTPVQAQTLAEMLAEVKANPRELFKKYQVEKIEDLPASVYDEAVDEIAGMKPVETLSQDQIESIAKLSAELGADISTIIKFYSVMNLESVPAAAYKAIIRSLEKKRKKPTNQGETHEPPAP